jgi:dTDP-4-amino-4,6-dideoxygalactose transaminase
MHAVEIEAAVCRVMRHGHYVLGPAVSEFEAAFAAFHGVSNAVGVANGTDAIELALRAAGIGPGDEVITVSHTATPTVCAVERAGATPVLVDIDPRTCTMAPSAAAAAITPRTRALLPVHLYGHPADMAALVPLAQRANLFLLEDCAQAHGARFEGKLVGTFGDAAAFSFYPTKNLGALGDGGAVLTRDALLAERVRRLRNYGQVSRYQHQERGMNSRLDEVQASVLSVRLTHLEELNDARRTLARHYDSQLAHVILPQPFPNEVAVHHVYHLYVVRHPHRDQLQERLRQHGVGTLIHYPTPVHLQPAYASLGYPAGSLPVTERVVQEILSLPLYIGMSPGQIDHVAEAVNHGVREVA